MPDPDLTLEPESPERDENTSEMFASEPLTAPASDAGYVVLARKYRPQSFEDMIGQEAMVRTLRNAFASGRIAHAFMLTGVRGVGKTTTARLLARALNYDSSEIHQPTVELAAEGRHCRSIIEGRHIDVLELDAASRTKVDEMRELLDGVRYAPVDARYKVYIIDEVHMLSTAAFNALLKTLEEPPPHAKFIFATTEIRKVPVTILSRCQRFDLRRVEPEVIAARLEQIASAEGAKIEADGLTLIGRAAEGSVRDGLSMLDQAIVQSEAGGVVTAEAIRDMLGLADRGQTIALMEEIARGHTAEALQAFRTLYGFGADPVQVLGDLLEHAHGAALAKALGPEALGLPKDQAARLTALGAGMSGGALSRLWQLLLKAQDEARRAGDPKAAAEMAIIRLCYAADLPGPEEALKALQKGQPVPGSGAPQPSASGGGGGGSGGGSAATARVLQPKAAPQPASMPSLQSFEDVLRLIDARRDVTLKLDVERFVRPISFRAGAITFELAPGAPGDLQQRLVQRLKEWTGQAWLTVVEGGGGAESLYERARREAQETRNTALADPFVQSLLEAFQGAEVVEVRQLRIETPDAPDEPGEDPADS
jgi:DNA polymerase-3 subunit gamma/tau